MTLWDVGRSTCRRWAAGAQNLQADAIRSGRQAELLPLEVKVSSLPLLVGHTDAVRDGQRQWVGLLSDVKQLQLVEERSPWRNVGLSATHTVANTVNDAAEGTSMRA